MLIPQDTGSPKACLTGVEHVSKDGSITAVSENCQSLEVFEIEIGCQDTFLSLSKNKNEKKMKRWREKRERKRKEEENAACFHLQFWFKVKGLHLLVAFFPAEFETGPDLTWQVNAWEI